MPPTPPCSGPYQSLASLHLPRAPHSMAPGDRAQSAASPAPEPRSLQGQQTPAPPWPVAPSQVSLPVRPTGAGQESRHGKAGPSNDQLLLTTHTPGKVALQGRPAEPGSQPPARHPDIRPTLLAPQVLLRGTPDDGGPEEKRGREERAGACGSLPGESRLSGPCRMPGVGGGDRF